MIQPLFCWVSWPEPLSISSISSEFDGMEGVSVGIAGVGLGVGVAGKTGSSGAGVLVGTGVGVGVSVGVGVDVGAGVGVSVGTITSSLSPDGTEESVSAEVAADTELLSFPTTSCCANAAKGKLCIRMVVAAHRASTRFIFIFDRPS